MNAGQGAMLAAADEEVWLPGVEQLLVEGGDERLALDPHSGLNRYLCGPTPDPELLSFGSSTASVISEAGFAAALRLRQRLATRLGERPAAEVYADELGRIRHELFALCGLDGSAGVDAIFAASGTDLLGIAAQLYGATRQRPALAISIDTAETGSGVPDALCGRRPDLPQLSGDGAGTELACFSVRHADGTPRPAAAVDAEVEAMADAAVAAGKRVLLIVSDVSKSGLISPSPACALALSRRHGEALNILVDACQFRLAPSTLRAYLEQGCAVALTGSKFISGPAFSGILLLPAVQGPGRESPVRWPGSGAQGADFGLLPRWAAALEEMRALAAVDDDAMVSLLHDFAAAVGERLRQSPFFEQLPQPLPRRRPLVADTGWDALPSIFPFLALHPDGRPLSREQSRQLYRWLQTDMSGMPGGTPMAALRGQLGQPIACGERGGTPVSALRLCVGARNIVAAAAQGNGRVIDQALSLLDKAEWLIGKMYVRPRPVT